MAQQHILFEANRSLTTKSDLDLDSGSKPTLNRTIRVCVCTSHTADREPRGPRHARALFDLGGVHLTFIDTAPEGYGHQHVQSFEGISFDWHTLDYPLRTGSRLRWLAGKIRQRVARKQFEWLGLVRNDALSASFRRLESMIVASRPDIVMAHNIETLLPAYRASQRCDAMLVFDSMEYHADMGDGQDETTIRLTRAIESRCLPQCSLITTSGPRVSAALHDVYGVEDLVALYNMPAVEQELAATKEAGFGLYWRNTSIGLGQRGLEDAMRAIVGLPSDVRLHLQGNLPADRGAAVSRLAEQLGIADRLVIHPPYRREAAVREASRFHVGLCLERPGIRNHELTVSNKMFDYHMAGLAVVASDLPSLRDVINDSGGGLVYRAGDSGALRQQLLSLYEDRDQYANLARRAREYALQKGNLSSVVRDFSEAMRPLLNCVGEP